MRALQRRAGNRAVAGYLQRSAKGRPVVGHLQREVMIGPVDAGVDEAPLDADAPVSGVDTAVALSSGAPPDDGAAGADDSASPSPAGGSPPAGETEGSSGILDATRLTVDQANTIADLAVAEPEPDRSRLRPHAARATGRRTRRAAAGLLPDRADDLGFPPPAPVQRSASAIVQRDPTQLPVQKVTVPLTDWESIPLFPDVTNKWFVFSGAAEAPTFTGEATPPKDLRAPDGQEVDVKIDPSGKVKGFTSTFYSETIAKSQGTEVDGKVAVEVTAKGVKVTGMTVKFPNWGEGGDVLQGELNFDVLDWEAGQPPSVMVLSYTKKIGAKHSFTKDGWAFTGELSVPIKFSIKPNPATVAEFVARTLGPRLAAAAGPGLAIGAPAVAGAVCLEMWVNAIETGKESAELFDDVVGNTRGWTSAYVGTLYGHDVAATNAGAKRGVADAERVLTSLRFHELPPGAQQKMRDEYLPTAKLDVPGQERLVWNFFKANAIASYRKKHSTDAWCYDRGLPSDLGWIVRRLDQLSPPWSMASY